MIPKDYGKLGKIGILEIISSVQYSYFVLSIIPLIKYCMAKPNEHNHAKRAWISKFY